MQLQLQHKPPLQGNRPYVIAHRGASGPLPEHTLPAYTAAVAQGADFIECDVVVTQDLQLICRHEPNLNSTTDAWQHFSHRVATYTIDGEPVSGIFASDLTLAEIKQLRAKQRWAFRDRTHDGAFEVATLGEFLDVAQSAPRAVGIYPEVKHPTWHNALPQLWAANTTLEKLIVGALHARGYAASAPVNSAAWRAQPVFVQSFEPTSLQRLAGMTRMPLVLLMGGWDGYVAPDTGMSHEQMVGHAFLSELAGYVAGVGPWKNSLYTSGVGTVRLQSNGVVAKLHSYGFQVHPYTLRDEAQFVPDGCGGDVGCEIAWLFDGEGCDGGFADWPRTLHEWLLRRTADA
ncbi:glycerophosphoryl diester phosphodiesterase family protein [Scenedesmus sp. NREL 46B-D3]|nr:glycerophosphoryl diester phosphodiesterase family protein [Scenedesmus sp. NREL 46B-D3]